MESELPFHIWLTVVLVPGLPLLACLLNWANILTGERLYSQSTMQLLTWGSITAGFINSWILLYYVLFVDPTPQRVVVWTWFVSGDLRIELAFLLDRLAVFMMIVATIFPVPIAWFSRNYFQMERSYPRFFTIMPILVVMLAMLVMGGNYLTCFLGWEGVGLMLSMLIGFHYERPVAVKHATKASLMGRVGDVGFLLAIFMIAKEFGTLDYLEVQDRIETQGIDEGVATAIALCLLLAAMAKSAQLPFSSWLTTAMEGPTPASALIHAAVQDGVYLVGRNHFFFDQAPNALLMVTIIGAATAFFSGTVGLVQTHIKGILAYSTISQLGIMFVACGLGWYAAGVFHMLTHAAVKTYLFLTSPSIIHHLPGGADNSQKPERNQGRLLHYFFLLGALGMVLVPFFSEWFRTEILGHVIQNRGDWVLIAFVFMMLFTTAFYTRRLVNAAFAHHGGHGGDDEHGHEEAHGHGQGGHHHTPSPVVPALLAFGVMALTWAAGLLPGGFLGTWFQVYVEGSRGDPFTSDGIALTASNASPILVGIAAALLVLVFMAGWLTALYHDRYRVEAADLLPSRWKSFYLRLLNKFYIDEMYEAYTVRAGWQIGRALERFDTKVVDRAVGIPLPTGRVPVPSALEGPPPRAKVAREAWKEARATMHTDPVVNARGLLGALAKIAALPMSFVETYIVRKGLNEGTANIVLRFGHLLLRIEAMLGGPPAIVAVLLLIVLVAFL
ncbi:MAG: hypothetical protein MJD61_05795 [Proteobacteria bacterium]|nr:hypothetical protein [Pseudomonadota bacterium]